MFKEQRQNTTQLLDAFLRTETLQTGQMGRSCEQNRQKGDEFQHTQSHTTLKSAHGGRSATGFQPCSFLPQTSDLLLY